MFAVKLLNNREKTHKKRNIIALVGRNRHFSNLTPTEVNAYTDRSERLHRTRRMLTTTEVRDQNNCFVSAIVAVL